MTKSRSFDRPTVSTEVNGLNGTTVTPGLTQPLTVTRHIKIDLKKGDNSVELIGAPVRFLVPKDLSIKTLDGMTR